MRPGKNQTCALYLLVAGASIGAAAIALSHSMPRFVSEATILASDDGALCRAHSWLEDPVFLAHAAARAAREGEGSDPEGSGALLERRLRASRAVGSLAVALSDSSRERAERVLGAVLASCREVASAGRAGDLVILGPITRERSLPASAWCGSLVAALAAGLLLGAIALRTISADPGTRAPLSIARLRELLGIPQPAWKRRWWIARPLARFVSRRNGAAV